MDKNKLWPSLLWSDWSETAKTVHLFTQIIGKIRLALMPMETEWAQVPLTVNSRGLVSLAMPTDFGSMDIAFDFISHSIIFYSSNGNVISFQLKGLSVADFLFEVQNVLKDLKVTIKINPMSVEMMTPVRMDNDKEDKTYDDDAVNSWWHVLVSVASVFEEYRSGFWGKQSPVSFFWGGFDLAVTRFSGKPVEPQPGQDLIYRVGMDAEQSSVGFWPGNDDAPEAIFFGYTFPKPNGLENTKINPPAAKWSTEKGEFILPYEEVRASDNPKKVLLEFCNSTYKAGAELAKWDTKTLERKPPVKPKKSNA